MTKRYTSSFLLKLIVSFLWAIALIIAGGASTQAQTAGPNNAGSGANVAASTGNVAWSNPGNAVSSNDSRAIADLGSGGFTQYLRTTNYGFSIPNDATILGITVSVERNSQNSIRDNEIRLLKNSVLNGDNKASSTEWVSTDATASYGGSSDLWGTTWSPTDINNSNFGVSLRAERFGSGGGNREGRVDAITVSVTYSVQNEEPEGPGDPEIGEEARPTGVYRSVKTGTWSDPETWEQEMIDDEENTNWVAATQYPSTDMIALGFSRGTQESASATHVINIPGSTVGEMLIVAFSARFVSDADVHIGTGWSKLDQGGFEGSGNETITGAIFYKIASGNDALTISTSSNVQSSHVTYRVRGAKRISGTFATGNDDEPNPPLFAPADGSGDYFWLATAHLRGNVSTDGNPDDFSNVFSSTAYSGANGTSTTIAMQFLNAASLDPTAFSATDETAWVSFTLVLDAGDPAAAAIVRNEHVVTTTASVKTLSVIVEDGGTLVVNDAVSMSIANGSTMDIEDGGTLYMLTGTSLVNGPGNFDLQSGGILKIGSNQGIHASSDYGNIQVDGTRSYSSGGYYVYQGTSMQDPGAGLPTTVAGLEINNSGSGLFFLVNQEVSDQLTLTQGIIHMNSNVLTVSHANPLAVSGGSVTSFVSGELRRGIEAGDGTYAFPIGADTQINPAKITIAEDDDDIVPLAAPTYAPVTVEFQAGSSAGVLAASTSSEDSESLGSSSFNSDETVNRTWTVVPVEGLETVEYDIALNWDANDEDEDFDVDKGYVGKYDAETWSYPDVTNSVGTSITATGLSSFSDFQVGSQTVPTIITEPVSVSITYGADASFEVVIDFDDEDAAFQWQVLVDENSSWTDLTDDAIYGGSTERILNLSIPLVSMSGYKYRVNVTCASPAVCDVVTSNGEAMLTVGTKELTIVGLVANDKIYDATDLAILDGTSANLVGVIDADLSDIGFENLMGTFDDAAVGEDKPVTTNLVLTGTMTGNYSLMQPDNLTSSITPATLTIGGTFTANDKPFDENTNATFSSNNLVLIGLIGSDDGDVSLSGVEIDFDDAFFDGLQPVRITSASLSGPAAGNYELLLDGAPTAEARIIMFRIWGYKFEDMNNNGLWDTGEPGVEGWEITISSSNGAQSTHTDATGFYAFDHVLPGTHSVFEEMRDGWQQSAPGGSGFAIVEVNVPQTLARVDFGNWRNASVTGFVYNDQTGSGSFDEGEVGLEGVTVNVVNLSNVIVGTTQTDSEGNFSIDGIAPGTYSVRIMPPNDMIQSQPEDFYLVTLVSGAQESDLQFGLFEAIDLNVFVFIREATKQIAETQDFALSGVKVSGVRSGPAPLKTAATGPSQTQWLANSSFDAEVDENGFFTASDLLPGEYTVSVTVPENWVVFTENPIQVLLIASLVIEIEFGIEYDIVNAPEIATSSITGSVFADATGSGNWPNASVGGLSGQTVTLEGTTRRGDEIARTASTGTGGLYSFTELPAGKYMVSVAPGSGLSLSSPGGSTYSIQLGDNQNVGGAPMANTAVAMAANGSSTSFAKMTLALDTNSDGSADTVVELAGNATFNLGGFTGQTSRPLTLESFAGRGSDSHGHPVTLSAPGLYKQAGTLESSLSGSSASFGAGVTLSHDDVMSYATAPVVFTGSVSSWPARHQTFMMTNAQPVALQSTMGSVIGHIITASLTPMHGADLGLQRADFGDAPVSYGTLRSAPGDDFVVASGVITYPNDGARHLLPFSGTASPVLGSSVTADQDGKPTAMADGDTDDGVDVPAQMERGASVTLTVRVTGTGLLSAWADWNSNGSFDVGEQVITNLAVSGTSSPYTLSINVPASAELGQTYLRFRISSQAGLSATGMASDGEVEDYAVNVVNELDNSEEDLSTNLDSDNTGLPSSFALRQNYPNPFNPTTVVPYELAGAGMVRLAVYDVTGRMVSTLISAEQSAGRYTATFNAAGLPSGVYMVRLEAGGQVMTRKLTLLK